MNDISTPSVLRTEPGSVFSVEGTDYEIVEIIDLDKFLCKDLTTSERCVVDFRTRRIALPWKRNPETLVEARDILSFSDDQWEQARARRDLIKPLLRAGRYGEATAKAISSQCAFSVSTLYRWHTLYRNSGGLLSSLIDFLRGGGRGKSRVLPEVDTIITTYLKEEYLTPQKPTIQHAYEQIGIRCQTAGYPIPSLNTVRLRISWIKDVVKTEGRLGKDAAEKRHAPEKGKIPNADFPLQLAQMDHTPLPVIIVDDLHRKPMGRAYFTALMDVNSRVILGIYLTLEAPSTTSAGMCIAHALLPKEDWLREVGLGDYEWPFFGTPDVLHMDNAGEFRGEALRFVANEYQIDLTFRPVKKPKYGGHIERLMGTLSTKLKSVNGATFSGPEEKGVYDADNNACLTFGELHRRLVVMISRYHVEKHSALGMSPRDKWKQGLLERRDGEIVRGLPPRRQDVEKVRMDFLPIYFRTIQSTGVEIDKITYQDDILHEFIGLKKKDSRAGVEYPFRRDPRDVSEILFFHPHLKRYFSITSGYERMSIWEYNVARKKVKDSGEVEELSLIWHYIMEARKIDDVAAEKTKSARRQVARRKAHEKAAKEKPPTENRTKPPIKGIDQFYNADATNAVPDEE